MQGFKTPYHKGGGGTLFRNRIVCTNNFGFTCNIAFPVDFFFMSFDTSIFACKHNLDTCSMEFY